MIVTVVFSRHPGRQAPRKHLHQVFQVCHHQESGRFQRPDQLHQDVQPYSLRQIQLPRAYLFLLGCCLP